MKTREQLIDALQNIATLQRKDWKQIDFAAGEYVDEYAGGNVDDAYDRGRNDGWDMAAKMAREALSDG